MADGIVKRFPSALRPVLEFCLENEINIMQMPCPEAACASGGLDRTPRGKSWYDRNGLRETSREIALAQAAYMGKLRDNDFEIMAIIGVEFSPACAVNYLNRGPSIYRDQGIYIEELQAALSKQNLEIPFIGVSAKWHKKMVRDLDEILSRHSTQSAAKIESHQIPAQTAANVQ